LIGQTIGLNSRVTLQLLTLVVHWTVQGDTINMNISVILVIECYRRRCKYTRWFMSKFGISVTSLLYTHREWLDDMTD